EACGAGAGGAIAAACALRQRFPSAAAADRVGCTPLSLITPTQRCAMPGTFTRTRSPAFAGTQGRFDLSWELFGEMCRVLAMRVARDYRPDVVIGIATAGVMPAATMAAMLEADFEAMKVSRRDGDSFRSEPQVMSATPVLCRGKRVLIVDEITTSG